MAKIPTSKFRPQLSILLLGAGGQVDATFAAKSSPRSISALVLLPDNSFLAGGVRLDTQSSNPSVPGTAWLRLDRFLLTGEQDTNFVVRGLPEAGVQASVLRKVIIQPDAKIVFFAEARTELPGPAPGLSVIGRLLPDGQWDPEFHMVTARSDQTATISSQFPFVTPTPGPVADLARQTNGILVLGGTFDSVDGEPRLHLARLDPEGELRGRLALKLENLKAGEIAVLLPPEVPVPYVLEHSEDLRRWAPLQTNSTPWLGRRVATPVWGSRQFFRALPQD